MEKAANQIIEETQEAHAKVPIFSLELLQDKLEYINVKADFFENQNVILNEIIYKVELEGKELLKEEQELTDKLAERTEVKKNLVNILKGFKSQRKVEALKKNDETFIRNNGFYHCPECSYTTKWHRNDLIAHINTVHRKLKPWKCSDCTKSKRIKIYYLKYFFKYDFSISDFSTKQNLSQHRLSIHNTNKSLICDCCGSRFGYKNALKIHMLNHLPPSFSCSECDKKFVYVKDLKTHEKLHRGILNEFCKLCNKGFATKVGLSDHIILNHFAKFNCEVTGCSSVLSNKGAYKIHLKSTHKKDDQVLNKKLILNLEKLKPNYQQLKYV